MEKENEILEGVQKQISSFDTKASILLSAVGVVFALTLSFLDVFHAGFYLAKDEIFKIIYCILFTLYIVATIIIFVFLVLVIVPRRHKQENKYPNYYVDINKLSKDELKDSIKEYYSSSSMILEQIKANASICDTKHKFLARGIWALIPFISLIIGMIIMIIV